MRASVLLVALAACYSPHPQTGGACPSGVCPEPLVCSPATRTCELAAGDAARGDAAIDARADAAPDGAVMPDAARTAQLVQQAVAHADGASLVIALPAPPAAGDVLVFVGGDVHAPLSPTAGVTGGGVATWTRAAYSSNNTNCEIWYGVASGTGQNVTVTGFVGDTSPIFGSVSEWSGLATTGTLDAARARSGLSSPADPPAITTTSARDLVIFGVGDGAPNAFGAPAPGAWTPLTGIQADISLGVWYELVGPTIVHSTVTETAGSWDAAVAAFTLAP